MAKFLARLWQQQESTVITLPQDPARIEHLGKALGLYSALRHRRIRYQPPDAFIDLIYLIEIISGLLKDGSVRTSDISRGISKRYGHTLADAGGPACAAVDAYCTNGNPLPFIG